MCWLKKHVCRKISPNDAIQNAQLWDLMFSRTCESPGLCLHTTFYALPCLQWWLYYRSTIANVMLMPHVVVNEVQGIGTLARIVHQAHTVCSQLIHISNVLLPKHMLSRRFGIFTTTPAICKHGVTACNDYRSVNKHAHNLCWLQQTLKACLR